MVASIKDPMCDADRARAVDRARTVHDALYSLDLARSDVIDAVNARQQAEEERDAIRADLSALDLQVLECCIAAGVENVDQLLPRIRSLIAERDNARRITDRVLVAKDAQRRIVNTAVEQLRESLERAANAETEGVPS
jgi:hypothetical protein